MLARTCGSALLSALCIALATAASVWVVVHTYPFLSCHCLCVCALRIPAVEEEVVCVHLHRPRASMSAVLHRQGGCADRPNADQEGVSGHVL